MPLKYSDKINPAMAIEEPQLDLLFEKKNEIKNKQRSETLNMLSLFSGCGGMDLGFEGHFSVLKQSVNEELSPDFIEKEIDDNFYLLKKTRFKTVFANDIFSDARNTWIKYFSKRGFHPEQFYSDSIVDLVKQHLNGVEVFPQDIDIVTGGFPCQDFSISGKRNGLNSHKDHNGKLIEKEIATEETRGNLYMWMKQVIEITKPKIFIAENVKGLTNFSNVKEIIQNDFSSAGDNGYIVLDPQVLHAADFGIPQSRERVIFIGIKKSALKKSALKELTKNKINSTYNPYPSPTHSYNFQGEKLKTPTILENIFNLLDEPELSDDLSHKFYSKAKFMGEHCQGQTEVKLDSIGPTIRSEHHGNIEFRRLSRKNGGKNLNELFGGLSERRLTPRECALIQSFPLDFEFVINKAKDSKKNFLVSPSQAYKVIGNAVPPLLAYNIARRIESNWDLYFKK